jgi:hypothetical protein
VSARRIEQTASSIYDALASEFVEVQSSNATSLSPEGLPEREPGMSVAEYSSLLESGSYQDDVPRALAEVRGKPVVEDSQAYWTYNDLIREIDGKFRCDGSPFLHDGKSLKGKVILINYDIAAESQIRDLLAKVFRANDLLLTDGVQYETTFPVEGDVTLSAAPSQINSDQACLGVESSRCLHYRAYEQTEFWNVVVETGAEHPGRTLYVVSDARTTETLRRRLKTHQGLAMILTPIAEDRGSRNEI